MAGSRIRHEPSYPAHSICQKFGECLVKDVSRREPASRPGLAGARDEAYQIAAVRQPTCRSRQGPHTGPKPFLRPPQTSIAPLSIRKCGLAEPHPGLFDHIPAGGRLGDRGASGSPRLGRRRHGFSDGRFDVDVMAGRLSRHGQIRAGDRRHIGGQVGRRPGLGMGLKGRLRGGTRNRPPNRPPAHATRTVWQARPSQAGSTEAPARRCPCGQAVRSK
jgi:hypothetical protein